MSTTSTNYLVETAEDYETPFSGSNMDNPIRPKAAAALDRAWKNRDFEIDKYWSRATYFWAFIAATFAGYIAIKASTSTDIDKKHLGFTVNCLGIIFSWAWMLVNKASKAWQENWEKHIDMLEDDFTGPIYKTVRVSESYSVSKINIHVSVFVVTIWLLLAGQEIFSELSIKNSHADFLIILPLVATAICIGSFYTHAKSGKGSEFQFERRAALYKESPKQASNSQEVEVKESENDGANGK